MTFIWVILGNVQKMLTIVQQKLLSNINIVNDLSAFQICTGATLTKEMCELGSPVDVHTIKAHHMFS